MRHTSRWSYSILILMFALAALAGCKKEDDAKSGVVGTLVVEGGSPDGATAMLFRDPSPSFNNTSVWWVTARQQAVGFRYNPQAAFDWRAEIAPEVPTGGVVAVGANGEFNIGGVDAGQYILVVEKPGFGWTAPLSVNLSQPSVNVGTLRLYPEEELRGITMGHRTLQSDRHYVIREFETFTVAVGDTLRVAAGAVVRGDDSAKLRVQGSLVVDGQTDRWVVFTSNRRSNLSGSDWEGIHFQSAAGGAGIGRFRYASFRNGAMAIRTEGADCEVEHCYFGSTTGYGIYASTNKTVVTRSVFNAIYTPMYVFQPDSVRIDHNIIFSARTLGVELKRVNGGSVFCNWFEDCGQPDSNAVLDVGVLLLQDTQNLEISRNNFYTSWYAFNIQGGVRGSTLIHRNRFDRMIRIIDLRAAPSQGPSFPTFQYNCMLTVDGFFIFVHACSPTSNDPDIDARFDYWNSTSADFAHSKINDCRDNPDCPCVDISPIETACQPDAGICAQ